MHYNADNLEEIGQGLGHDLNALTHWARGAYNLIFDDFNILELVGLVIIFE